MKQKEFDRFWAQAARYEPDALDIVVEQTCQDMEPDVADVPTWEQLAPLYA